MLTAGLIWEKEEQKVPLRVIFKNNFDNGWEGQTTRIEGRISVLKFNKQPVKLSNTSYLYKKWNIPKKTDINGVFVPKNYFLGQK